jgi:hypothetical protein
MTIQTPFGTPGFLMLAGSRMHGTHTADSDHDYLGAVIEPPSHVIGLDGYEQTTLKERGVEGTIYSLRKLVRLIADGNPTVLCLPYGTPLKDDYGLCTQEFISLMLSRKAGRKFIGYMDSQRKSMLGERSQSDQRKTLIEAHGFDTKFAGHMIRLGWQGIEYLDTGRINVPMAEARRSVVLDIRAGRWPLSEVLAYADALRAELDDSMERTTLPEEPDRDGLNDWLAGKYLGAWSKNW